MKKNIPLFFMLALMVASNAFAVDFLNTLKTTAETQATSNIFPLIMFIAIAAGAVYAWSERSWSPLVWTGIGSALLAMSPNLGSAITTQFNGITF